MVGYGRIWGNMEEYCRMWQNMMKYYEMWMNRDKIGKNRYEMGMEGKKWEKKENLGRLTDGKNLFKSFRYAS